MIRCILASQSYYRQKLLRMAGLECEIIPSEFEEHAVRAADFATHEEYISALAAGKVLEVADRIGGAPHTVIIGGDLDIFHEGVTLHKPSSLDQARDYIQRLMGTTHKEVCATAVWTADTGVDLRTETISVTLPPLRPHELDTYIEESSPLSKAGAFCLTTYQRLLNQRHHANKATEPIEISGSISAVLGISLPDLEQLLEPTDVHMPRSAHQVEVELHQYIASQGKKES